MVSNSIYKTNQQVKLDVYYVDPFLTDEPGSGNPAAVCIVDVDMPLADLTMSYIAQYLNQSETVFARKKASGEWDLRWYTPAGDSISPGGNGTVALAYVLLNLIEPELARVRLTCRFSQLDSWAERKDDLVTVVLPSVSATQINPEFRYILSQSFSGYEPHSYLIGEQDLIMVFDSEDEIRDMNPDFSQLVQTNYVAYIVTAKGDRGGFVYRTFLTSEGKRKWEDPVSARALMNLLAYWSPLLGGKQDILAQSLSKRGGEANCRLADCDGNNCVVVTAKCAIRSGPNRFYFDALGGEFSSDSAQDPFIWR
jgi:PhzF family phenazine biosynthesis protein